MALGNHPVTGSAPRVWMVLEGWGQGGTEAFLRELVLWLHQHNVARVSLCLLAGDEASRRVAAQAVTGAVEGVHVLGRVAGWGTFGRLFALLRRERPDICHLHLYSSLLPALLAARAAGARVVSTLHMPLSQWSPRHRLAWRLAVRGSHGVTMGSRATAASFGRWGPRDRVHLIWPPLAPAWRETKPASRSDVSGGDFQVMGVGRLAKEKDWPTLVRAVGLLKDRSGAEVRLRIRGEGPLRETLLALAREAGIALELPGMAEPSVLIEELAAAQVFVLPSRFEGLGMAAIEAMARGVPAITADFGASADFIEPGVTGHTFPRGDAEALAALLDWHRQHPAAAAVIGARGQALVRERFHPDAVFASLPAVYGEVSPGALREANQWRGEKRA